MTGTYAEIDQAEMERALAPLRRAEPAIAERALDLASETLIAEAQAEAPVATGFLQGSHSVDTPRKGERVLGVNAGYALAVHETHPTKSRWFINTISRRAKEVFRGALQLATREVRP